ncbi:PREDICTED: pectate lyase-like [Ipomoea nil]|uniref:pectate lyase-like n=1 Tax=Ipomoea nil TaxID=35883 RepID=UPI00090125A6|nr:PREDICTED: pectate lyase-like [Ipomoea nil]
MEGNKQKHQMMFLLVVAITALTTQANIGHFDEVWQERAAAAQKAARNAYNPNPHNVTNHLNENVHMVVNSTRRGLNHKPKYKGPCMATNPIDKCWRCNKNWAKNRMKLADCSLGFGRNAQGGKGGKIYVVTDPSDRDLLKPKPGTLRHAVIQPGPLWIIFGHSMVIRLSQELILTSRKTIDGRGQEVHITNGAGLTLQFINHVIIHSLHIRDIKPGKGGMIRDSVKHYGLRTKSDGDGISIFGATNIWIDHVSMSNCVDGIIDAVMASTAITISNCHFTRHNEVLLFGASGINKQDKVMQITLAFNHFGHGLVQRMPRVRYGFVHAVNNDYTHWLMYAIGGSHKPTILSQGNRFIAPPNGYAKEVTKREYAQESEWKNWAWKSDHDLMMNGAFFRQSGNPKHVFPHDNSIKPMPGTFVGKMTRFAGHLHCIVGKPC